jgi:hypothetical protein
MGAWETGSFDNDDALDWLFDLEDSADTSVISAALQDVLGKGDEYLETGECCVGVAAAEIVAALSENPGKLPDNAKAWVETNADLEIGNLISKALKAVKLVRTDSELKEVWDESEDAAAWYAALDNLTARLESAKAGN